MNKLSAEITNLIKKEFDHRKTNAENSFSHTVGWTL